MSTTSRHSRGGCGGFTLLEVLVALLLLVIIAAALYGSYFSVLRARERAGAGNEARREQLATLDQLRREISAALYRTSTDGNTPAYRKLRFIVEDRDMYGKAASTLELTTIAPPGWAPADLPSSDVVLVKYSVRETDGKLSLVREGRDLYTDLKPLPYPQMEELTAFLVECYSGGKWVRSWNADPSLNNRLPEKVRITISIKDGDGTADFTAIAAPKAPPKESGQ